MQISRNVENEELWYVVDSLHRYWPRNQRKILQLPIPKQTIQEKTSLSPMLSKIILPDWAADIGVNDEILIPVGAIVPGVFPEWQQVDWFAAIFWFLNGTAERRYERRFGPIHSYSLRLKGWDSQLWDRAWVNRIALFLRRWAARIAEKEEGELFGTLPKPEILLTHDVDAVRKTPAIRLKQSAFHLFNALRSLRYGNLKNAHKKFIQGLRFLLKPETYWCFDQITTLEEHYDVRSCFNFYGGKGGWGRTPKEILFDPAYNVLQPRLRQQLRALSLRGWKIGLHQSFNAWNDTQAMQREKTHLEQAVEAPVTICRQHWMRFSWQQTWPTQEQAGLKTDTTLGFNDRPGFRNGAALCFHPWDETIERPLTLVALPMVLMDSHLYDYNDLEEEERQRQIEYWLDEIRKVHGMASIIWHQRVMSADYGWGSGYEYLLSKTNFVDSNMEGKRVC